MLLPYLSLYFQGCRWRTTLLGISQVHCWTVQFLPSGLEHLQVSLLSHGSFFSNHNFTYSADLSFTPSPDRRSLGYSPDLAAVPSWASFSANNSYAPMLESSLLSRGILHDRSLFSGLLSCPASKNTTAGAGDCVKALADPNPDPDPDDGINEQFRKRDDPVHRCRSLPSCTAKVKSDYRCSG
jgi:hypothetical protein